MADTPTSAKAARVTDELLPCPFCGGKAEIVHIDEGENAGGSCVCCTRCMASGNVEFEFKENFVSNWNRRSIAPDAEPVAWLCNGKGDGWEEKDKIIRDPELAAYYRASDKWTVEALVRATPPPAKDAQPVAPDYWTVHSANGTHIGLWDDEELALKVVRDYGREDNKLVITPLFKAAPLPAKDAVGEAIVPPLPGHKRYITMEFAIDFDGEGFMVRNSTECGEGATWAQVYQGMLEIKKDVDRQIAEKTDCPFHPKSLKENGEPDFAASSPPKDAEPVAPECPAKPTQTPAMSREDYNDRHGGHSRSYAEVIANLRKKAGLP